MECRAGCGACCIAPSIHSPLPGMPGGKAAGEPCVNLDPGTFLCRLWGTADYPDLCRRFAPAPEHCGATRSEAIHRLSVLESQTGGP